MFDPILETEGNGSTEDSPSSGADWKSLLRTSQAGLPLLLSYESSWSCSRLRYQVLLNALRLFRPGSALLQRAEKAFANGARGLLEQFQLSDTLDLRFVDAQGTSLQAALPPVPPTVAPTSKLCFLLFLAIADSFIQPVEL